MIMPAFGDSRISPRIRLILALAISVALSPTIKNMPLIPTQPTQVLMYIFAEIAFGLLIGSITKIITSAVHVAGSIIGMQSSLAQSALFDPSQGAQSSIFGIFMELIVVTLLFALDLHHMLILGIASSYEVFAPGTAIPFADFASAATTAVSKSFMVGVQLAAPMIIVGILINLASGLLARLMPAFQVFFVIMPAQILISIFIFMTTLSAGIIWYLDFLEVSFTNLVSP